MSDRQYLLLVLIVLYLVECLFWVKRGGVVLRTWLGRRWAYVADSEFARNDRGGLHWAWPLPPLGDVLVCRGFPISFGPLGILAFKAESLNPSGRPIQSGRFVRWADIQSVQVRGKKVEVNGELFWAGDTVHTSERLSPWLKEMAKTKPEKRLPELKRALNGQFDRTAFAVRLRQLRDLTVWLEHLCTALLVYLFGFVPVVIARFGWLPALWWLVPMLFVQTGIISVLFVRAHRRLFPHASEDRFKFGLVYALAPASTPRARDPLTRGALEAFHPLCAAAELLAPEAFISVARSSWRDLKFPRVPECDSANADAVETERWYRAECVVALAGLLAKAKLDPQSWTLAPKPTEAVHTQYCPRCEAQFTKEATGCNECGGRALLRLEPV